VVQEFIHSIMSRYALDRLLRRRGVSRLPVEEAPARPAKAFKAYESGYLHIDVKYQIPAADAWRDAATLPVRRHRSRDTLGLYLDPREQERRFSTPVFVSAACALSGQDSLCSDGQLKGDH
jgi:hypothetical protein